MIPNFASHIIFDRIICILIYSSLLQNIENEIFNFIKEKYIVEFHLFLFIFSTFKTIILKFN